MDIEKLREEVKAMDTTPPEGYLDGIEDQVLSKISSGGRRVMLTRSLSIAASVAVLLLAGLWWTERTGEVDVYAQVSDDVLAMHYVEAYDGDWLIEDDWLEEVTVDDIVDLLEDDGADEDVYALMYKIME
jgi:hypothetical protein